MRVPNPSSPRPGSSCGNFPLRTLSAPAPSNEEVDPLQASLLLRACEHTDCVLRTWFALFLAPSVLPETLRRFRLRPLYLAWHGAAPRSGRRPVFENRPLGPAESSGSDLWFLQTYETARAIRPAIGNALFPASTPSPDGHTGSHRRVMDNEYGRSRFASGARLSALGS